MTPYYDHDNITIYNADCLEVMQNIPDNSIDTIITDPPYHLGSITKRFKRTSLQDDNITGHAARNGAHQYARLSSGFMGQEWDGGGIAFDPATWAEVLRVAKPGAMLLAFGGTRTYHRLACAIEDAGWEIRNCVMWVYGSGFPKSLDIGKAIDKAVGAEREVVSIRSQPDIHGGSYQNRQRNGKSGDVEILDTIPATEAAQLWDGWGTALKPAYEPIVLAMKPLDGTFAANALKHGVAGLWIDGGRVETDEDRSRPPRTPNHIYGNGKGTNLTATSNNPQGRWPANLITDGSPEVLAGFPESKVSGSAKNGTRSDAIPKGIFGALSQGRLHNDSGSAARFFYCAKASRRERGEGNNHPTVKPLALLCYLVRLTRTPTGGIVLDPFMGSGTTLLAARAEGRQAIGIELSEEYCEIAVKRLNQPLQQTTQEKSKEPNGREPEQG